MEQPQFVFTIYDAELDAVLSMRCAKHLDLNGLDALIKCLEIAREEFNTKRDQRGLPRRQA